LKDESRAIKITAKYAEYAELTPNPLKGATSKLSKFYIENHFHKNSIHKNYKNLILRIVIYYMQLAFLLRLAESKRVLG